METHTPNLDNSPTRKTQKYKKPLIMAGIAIVTALTIHVSYALSEPTYEEHLEADKVELAADWQTWNTKHIEADKRVIEAQNEAQEAIQEKLKIEARIGNVRAILGSFQ